MEKRDFIGKYVKFKKEGFKGFTGIVNEDAKGDLYVDLGNDYPVVLVTIKDIILIESEFEQYFHHATKVWVRSKLKGKHREYCLCFACERLHPGENNNCEIAQKLYDLCVRCGLTTPVFECPHFKENKGVVL